MKTAFRKRCSHLGAIQVEIPATQGKIGEEGKGCRRVFSQGGCDIVICKKCVFAQVPFLERAPIRFGTSFPMTAVKCVLLC